MPHSRVITALAVASLLFSIAGPLVVDARQQREPADFRARDSYTDVDLAEAIFQSSKGIRPAPQLPRVVPEVVPEVSVALKVFFETNSANIIPRYYRELDKLGRVLTSADYSDRRVWIEGHTDGIGSDRYNQGLSEKRAQSVKQYLVQRFPGATERIEAIGYGKKRPIATDDTPEGREKNRRIEVVER